MGPDPRAPGHPVQAETAWPVTEIGLVGGSRLSLVYVRRGGCNADWGRISKSSERMHSGSRQCDDEPERKVGLLELAQRWLRLAFQVEQIQDPDGFRGDALLGPPDAKQRTH